MKKKITMSIDKEIEQQNQLPDPRLVRVGMLGFGTVGMGAYRMLEDNREAIIKKVGVPIEVVKIGVRDAKKKRTVPDSMITTDLESIVNDPSIDVVLELMGGVSPAGELIEKALQNNKHVVTANKELIAKKGAALVRLAAKQGLDLHFEAAVGGGIPLIQPLKHQLSGNDVIKMMGILNGTTNYILTKMSEEGALFEDVLKEAQENGYAEADPTSDVDGFDAQYKLAILASIGFGTEVRPEDVYREGIRGIWPAEFAYADMLGYRIKHIGVVEALESNKILARVHPTMIAKSHPLASVADVYNALWFQGDFVGDVMFSGRGAGSNPTGSAVIGDLIDVCRNIKIGGAGNMVPYEVGIEALPIDDVTSRYYLRIQVQDRPKALGCIATVFGNCSVSLAGMEMKTLVGGRGEIVFLTHPCVEKSFQRALKALRNIHIVDTICAWMRVED